MTAAPSSVKPYTVTAADRRAFWFVMLPALLEGVLLQLFGMIDTLMLGNTAASAVNIASVSLANTPHQFLLCVLNAFGIGTTTAIAFFTGQNDSRRVSAAVRQSALLMLLFSTASTVLCLIFAHPIVSFAGAVGELHDSAVLYFRILMLGFPIEMLTVVATACMRGIGLTRIALYYNVIASAVDVLGNYVLIYGKFGFPEMGVAGAALSTTLSKCISFGIALVFMLRTASPLRLRLRESFRFTPDILRRIFSVGIPTAVEQILLQGGNILAMRIVAGMDTASIAAYNICHTVNGLSWKPGNACQVATTSFTARDLGEGNPAKARARAVMVYRYSLGMCAFMTAFILLLRRPIAALFTPDTAIAALAGSSMIFDALGILGVTSHLTLSGALRAAGDSRYPLIASMVSIWLARVLLALLFARLGLLTVMLARLCVAVDQSIRGTIVAARFFSSDKWKAPPAKS